MQQRLMHRQRTAPSHREDTGRTTGYQLRLDRQTRQETATAHRLGAGVGTGPPSSYERPSMILVA